ncbi:serine/threonine protein kinase [Catenuloplanes nepalensis]|uniref:non-specific serine/threonine protein kinase n=1 Tax=Catenuloplanes nepalensis TaxID=587533 RepID=A0ABT9MNG5_9ACTN|nr:serine/threonine-protein kinase [Catenuloplanes nepalensis]MDP9792960.1 serine/threonine protein kinase [Catenuloplanes nepalensis]
MDEDWTLADRYRIGGPIGSGGMGQVWTAHDLQLDREVAVKLMNQPALPIGTPETEELLAAAAADRERFLREVRTTARLELPGVPAVYDVGVDPEKNQLFLVLQLIHGSTLADLISSYDAAEPAPVSWCAAVAAQAAATLADVHRVDIVHRDIKPSNMMVHTDGQVKILDFGVALLQGARALPKLTQLGATVGTPPYMSREQALGNPVGPPSDIYGLGCVLYEMLTGRVPFIQTSSRSYRDHHVNSEPPSLRAARLDVPAEIDQLFQAMLAKLPADRPSATAVYETLLPLAQAVEGGIDDRDPRRPFLRPLAPRRPRRQPPASQVAPMTVDEAVDIIERVSELTEDDQVHAAIALLDEAVARPTGQPVIDLELKIRLGTFLSLAEESTRAAAVLDEVLLQLDGDERAPELRYQAGASHAAIGNFDIAVRYLTSALTDAGADDTFRRDASYQLGLLLPLVGRTADGIRVLGSLRPQLVSEFGADSVHVASLDRRIARLERPE